MFNPFSHDDGPLTVTPNMSRNLTRSKWGMMRDQKALMDKELIRLGQAPGIEAFQFNVSHLSSWAAKHLKKHYEQAGWFVVLYEAQMSLLRKAAVYAFGSEYEWDNEPAVVTFFDDELLIEVPKDKFELRIDREEVAICEDGIVVDTLNYVRGRFQLMFQPPEGYMIIEEEPPDGDQTGEGEDRESPGEDQ